MYSVLARIFIVAAAWAAVDTARAAEPAAASTKTSGVKIRLLILSGANNHDWKSTTRGMKSFQHVKDELYHRQLKHATAKVLATAYSARNTAGTGAYEPMIAVTDFGKGRVFYMKGTKP